MKAVRISDYEWNYLKDDGTYLLDKNAKWCSIFNEGFGRVQYDIFNWNLLDLNGKKIFKNNVLWCDKFNKGFSEVEIKDLCYYYIDTECNFYNYPDKVSFKELYNNFPNIRYELIEIIEKYTYFDVNEYFV